MQEKSESLLSSSNFTMRWEKDIKIGEDIMQEVQQEQPLKGHLRMVSANWLNRFF